MIKARRNYKNSVRKGMKRYALRKKKVPGFTFTTDVTRVKCECYGSFVSVNASNIVTWVDSSQSYLSLATCLADSASFTTQVSLYQRYKIYGLSLTLAPTQSPTNLNVLYPSSLPQLCTVLYPNYTTTDLGQSIIYNDRKLLCDTINPKPVYKYWGFPDGFFDGGGFGLGIWSRTASYTAQPGQLSVSSVGNGNATSSASFARYLVTIYVMLSDKNQ